MILKVFLNSLIALLLFSNYCCSQITGTSSPNKISESNQAPAIPVAESISEAKAQGIDFRHLDSIYVSGVNIDSNKAAFKGHQSQFADSFRAMLGHFGHYLKHNTSFPKIDFSYWNRVYFKRDGTIDYYLYIIKEGVLTPDELALFKQSLNEFIKNYKFPMTANTPFAQCCPVTMMLSGK